MPYTNHGSGSAWFRVWGFEFRIYRAFALRLNIWDYFGLGSRAFGLGFRGLAHAFVCTLTVTRAQTARFCLARPKP